MARTLLHLIDTAGPGGAEIVFRNVLLGLDKNQWRSVPAIPSDDWLGNRLREHDIEPIIVPFRGPFDLRFTRRVFQLAREFEVDLIHAHLLGSSTYGSVVGGLLGLPVVCTLHGVNDFSERQRFQRIKFRLMHRPKNRLVFVSEALRKEFLHHSGLPQTRTMVVHNGIQTDVFRPGTDHLFRRELGVSEHEILIGAVGNFRWWKAYDVLLRSAAILKDRGIPCRIVVIGQKTRPLFDEIEALHKALGLNGYVEFSGLRDQIPRIMRNLDIYVSSSSDEGFSLTTVEAMASGLPVVATRSGGPEEIIEHGTSGLLVPRNDPEALADNLELVASNSELRAALSRGARKRAESAFSVQAMAQAYERLYEELLPPTGR